MTLALLHTSPVHVPVFEALRDADHPGLALRHLVHEDLLARARDAGPDAVRGEIEALLAGAVAEGATAVLCTCSTIGAVAESAAESLGVPVLRVDRPMAAAAVTRDRVVVLAAIDDTLPPTLALLAEEAGNRCVDIRTVLVEGAWTRFRAGDRDGYLDLVAAAADRVTDADVIVLAQASMADAATRAATRIPVLSSPRPGLSAAAAAAG
ncbi:aspartate/glutamate racemase family protein [Streptomyces sp. NBC_01762]|uniref:aspartate/glutamate racemase family protein n=1 Tax=unclassified Streptomyces TaxID=2593676 RepID=UPI002DD9EBC2|nr:MULTISPECIES: aspartate/glutamate racemase family protein [unclassified Streptomyces]WSC48740.1 aspartate/glutamate racemase family protein [Streptomyces sp. NBC_01762]WSC52288.1 aspartate/glutamate racemase family protein [Streptomyces sp. NBC_01761]WSD28392.1 aspartate/glutamate racemase family protein [Streptomyces sp. NBC_01751]